MTWIPVTERLPEIGVYVQAYVAGMKFKWMEVAVLLTDGQWHVRWAHHITMRNVTHWMELPEPPK